MNIKVILRDGDTVTIPSHGESAKSWLANVRRSLEKQVTLNTTAVLTADIVDAFDEKPGTPQTNLDGI
jgi:hypothetical protein